MICIDLRIPHSDDFHEAPLDAHRDLPREESAS